MILEPYPAYMHSGQQWLGSIPSGWKLSPVKHVARLLAGGTPESSNDLYWADDGGTSWVTIGDMSGRDIVVSTSRQVTAEGMATKTLPIAPPGTVLFAMYASVGEVAILGIHAAWNQALLGFVVNDDRADPKFVFYALKAIHGWLPVFYRSNTQNNLNAEQVGNLVLPLPEKAEQRAIVRYLDQETSELDSFIADQEVLISLLRERRTASISRAVTKGLDPDAPLKDSGFGWLGEVPAHWAMTSLKHYIEILAGYAFKSEDFQSEGTNVRLLRGININPGRIIWDDVVYFDYAQRPDLLEYELKEGDLVLGLDRPIVSTGIRVAAVGKQDLPSLVLQRVARIRAKDQVVQSFIKYLLESEVFAKYLAPLFTGVSVPHMSPGQLGSFIVALPERSQQHEIVQHLDRETHEIDAAIADARLAIKLSKERRAAVISAAVTGKIDVRGAKIPMSTDKMKAEYRGVA